MEVVIVGIGGENVTSDVQVTLAMVPTSTLQGGGPPPYFTAE